MLNWLTRVSVPHKQYYPRAGFVEHDPEEIFNNTLSGIKQLMQQSGIANPVFQALPLPTSVKQR